jgi:hypothetical protein
MATEPDFFVKQGDFQFLAAGRPMMFYRDPAKALADWEAGWRDLFSRSFPDSVAAIDAALGYSAGEDDEDDDEPQPA